MASPAVRARTLQRRLQQLADVTWPSSPLPSTARLAYLSVAAHGDWHGIAGAAKQQRASARQALTQLSRLETKAGLLAADIGCDAAGVLAAWVRPDSRDEWPQVRDQLMGALAPQTGHAKAERLVDAWGATTRRDFTLSVTQPLADLRGFSAASSQEWRGVLVGASLAEAVVALNTRRPRPLPTSLDAVISTAGAALKTRLTDLRDVLRYDRAAVATDAKALVRWARGAALEDAVGLAVDLAVARDRDDESRWRLGPAAEAVGTMVRDLLLAQAVGLTVASAVADAEDAAKPWRALSTHPVVDDLGPGHHVAIARLVDDPTGHDGTVLKVSGVVGNVLIKHLRGKVLSTVDLRDAEGRSVTVGLEHIKLDSCGMVEGAHATVAGAFVAADTVFHGPTLRITRHSYEAESAHSFVAGATHLSRQVFTPVAHGLRYASSWERGLSGANNQLRYGTWLPFERTM